ncbi:hypothetical protein [Streptomyces sp. NPDC057280]|uniref:hypothetical protein n=1 Tax=Streptomyces sp. NPDC057280 TaxID=3346081 RepID=UPI0009A45682|nr:hypothetical protein B1R27_27170 [Streptomyces sp. GKU 895]
MRRSVTLALALSAALTALTPTPSASAAALPGHVCFWPQPGEMGGGWCYDAGRGGYAELDATVRRNAKSFSSQVDRTTYVLHFPRSGGCLQRTVYGGDYSENWEWADKADAIDAVPHSDCQPG